MTISPYDDLIDSRDVISAIKELDQLIADAIKAEEIEYSNEHPEYDDLIALQSLQDEAESSLDWQYGERLIRDSYFTDYAEQIANDLVSGDFNQWPLTLIDWEAAAEKLKMDYYSVDYGGFEYWIRA